MTGRSIRVRLTAWYLVVLAVASVTLAGGGWWLLRRSVSDAADNSLSLRVSGVRRFIENLGHAMSPAEMQDEFREYAELTMGEALLEVTDDTGLVLCRPTMPGWDTLRDARGPSSALDAVAFADRASQAHRFRVAAARLDVQGRTYQVIAAIPMGPADDAIGRFQWMLALLLPAVLAFAFVGGYWISGRALAPVDRMTREAQAITVRHLDRRLDVPAADDELRRLAMTFNEMLARLQASVADMARLTAEASHELRTPVSLVRATAEVALGRDRPAADYRQALVEVLEHAERMSGLVGDLLSLARSDAGVEVQETSRVDVTQIARDVARDVQAPMRRGGLQFDVDIAPTPIDIEGQAESLHRLAMILIDNAMKYTAAGGRVRLAVSAAPASGDADPVARLSVVDTGLGIPPAEQPHVFDRFYRGTAARLHAADGSGLGLAIARTIVARHGGSITVEPGPQGVGCQAIVTLPLARTSGSQAG